MRALGFNDIRNHIGLVFKKKEKKKRAIEPSEHQPHIWFNGIINIYSFR